MSFHAAIYKEHGTYSRVDEITVLNFSFGFFRFILACESGCLWLFRVMIITNNHRSFLIFNTLIKRCHKIYVVITNIKNKTSSKDNPLTTDTVLMLQSASKYVNH